jgi:hypothetical protein
MLMIPVKLNIFWACLMAVVSKEWLLLMRMVV